MREASTVLLGSIVLIALPALVALVALILLITLIAMVDGPSLLTRRMLDR